MAKKFVRNITGTKIKGEHQEPLWTNIQNDLLSDDEDVAVRNKNEYHLLTDNLKTHLVRTNAFMSISDKTKNGLKLNVLQASDTEVKNAVDTPRVINPKQAKDMIEQRTPKIVRDIIETDVPQSDWNETDPNSKAFIRNKPDIENGGGGSTVTVPDFSSQSQAETGTNNDTIMTPKTTKQAIDKQVPLIVAEQATSIIEKNFEALPQPDWFEKDEESHGFIKNKPMFASTEETVNGTAGNKIVTPLGLNYALEVQQSDMISKVKNTTQSPLQLVKKGNELSVNYSDGSFINFLKIESKVSLSNKEQLTLEGIVGLNNYGNETHVSKIRVGVYIPKHDKVVNIDMNRHRGGVGTYQEEFYNETIGGSRVGVQENVNKESRFEFVLPALILIKNSKVKESMKQLVDYLHEVIELNDNIMQPTSIEVHVSLMYTNAKVKNMNTNMIINRDK